MKRLFFALVLFGSPVAFAQTVDVKDVSTDAENTTIEIRKGKQAEVEKKNAWEVHEATADIEGEISATEREAKAAWKKACDEWKKEVKKEETAENKILSPNCGDKTCGGEVGQKTCSSKGTYKIKTKVN
jgi:hypothetical protein